MMELNSRCKPSEFHTENNSNLYGAEQENSFRDKALNQPMMLWNQRLRIARERKVLSVPALARIIVGNDDEEAVATMRDKIYSYEKIPKDKNPVAQPRGQIMQQLAAALDVTVQWLRDGDVATSVALRSNVNEVLKNTNVEVAKHDSAQLGSLPNAGLANEPLTKTRRRIDVLGRAAGGREGKFILNGDRIDQIIAPPSVEAASKPYAVYVYGTSMVPRYEDGEMVIANPDVPYRPGHYVVVQLQTDEDGVFECYVKRLVRFNEKELVLEQLNPPKGHDAIMKFSAKRVHAIHKLVGPDGK